MILKIACVLLGLAISSSAIAQELWHGVSVGDSMDQVHRVFPQASIPTDPGVTGESRELLRVPQIDLAGAKFNIGFYFKEGLLSQVILSADRHGVSQSFADTLPLYERVTNLIREKYGRELSNSVKHAPSGIGGVAFAKWCAGPTQVSLYVVTDEERNSLLVSYF